MASLNEAPNSERIRIAFFGLRNAGKSTLVNAFTGKDIAIVSDTPGTTTDPVSKAMEIPPLGPCLVIDTAGLDDEGELGRMRVEKSLAVLAVCDVAVWVDDGRASPEFASVEGECRRRGVVMLVHRRGESAAALRERIASLKLKSAEPGLLDGLVGEGGRVLCVCPIDSSAPKGRLILPQVQLIRECLDRGIWVEVCQPRQLRGLKGGEWDLAVTDSQAFGEVASYLPATQRLTGFSILFARRKGDIAAYLEGISKLGELKDGDKVLVLEGCTHHRQCEDIGTVKIPRAVKALSGADVEFVFDGGTAAVGDFKLVVQCGGCMLTRREVMRRIDEAREAGVPVVNYGMILAKAAGLDVSRIVY
jgi:[FeFe] hydrogenase H-cluster maturation GTPase HydF